MLTFGLSMHRAFKDTRANTLPMQMIIRQFVNVIFVCHISSTSMEWADVVIFAGTERFHGHGSCLSPKPLLL
jgi:hypothetical protein